MFGINKQKIITDKDSINDILTRGVEEIFIKEHLEKKLLSGERLRIKFGIDPTSPHIHLGRAVPLLKLKRFQELGHQIVLIIGDFTAKIADPSDKLEKRPMLTDEQIKNNLKDYLKQIGLIIDVSKAEVRYNSEWLAKMNLIEVGQLLENFTFQQMARRRNFSERLEKGQDVFVVELMYPAMQGYDSVQIKSDVEIGGFDQLFNLKAGRTLQRRYGQEEQDILTVSMLLGTDGRKMSSSWGNVISLLDLPNDMFGKVMSVRDDLIMDYFTLCTNFSLHEISGFKKDLESGINPKEAKMKLAREIVKMYHGEKEAEEAEGAFENTFSKGEFPEDAQTVMAKKGEKLIEILVNNKIVESKSEFRRLVKAGAVSDYPDKKVSDPNETVGNSERKIKIGRKTFVNLKPD